MPVVRVVVARDWLPTAEWIERHGNESGVFDLQVKYVVTRSLLLTLPQMIADVVNLTDGTSLWSYEVIVDVQMAHPWSCNVPNIWLDVQPEDKGGSPGASEARRIKIRSMLRMAVNGHLVGLGIDVRPTFDIDVRPLTGSGVSVDQKGVIVQSW